MLKFEQSSVKSEKNHMFPSGYVLSNTFLYLHSPIFSFFFQITLVSAKVTLRSLIHVSVRVSLGDCEVPFIIQFVFIQTTHLSLSLYFQMSVLILVSIHPDLSDGVTLATTSVPFVFCASLDSFFTEDTSHESRW